MQKHALYNCEPPTITKFLHNSDLFDILTLPLWIPMSVWLATEVIILLRSLQSVTDAVTMGMATRMYKMVN